MLLSFVFGALETWGFYFCPRPRQLSKQSSITCVSVASLLLVATPFVTSSFIVPSNKNAPGSDAPS